MSKSLDVIGVKQLLNFTEKECEEYPIGDFYTSILAINGNDPQKLIKVRLFVQLENKKEILNFFSQKRKESAIKTRMFVRCACTFSRSLMARPARDSK